MTGGAAASTSRRGGRLLAAAGAAVAVAALLPALTAPAPAAAARAGAEPESYPVPASRTFALSGLGFGHGIGMSQFGAEGMGRRGKGSHQILRFYYPGTSRARVSTDATIRVALSGVTRREQGRTTVTVTPAKGLKAWVEGERLALPRSIGSAPVTDYRVVRTHRALAVRAYAGATSQRVAGGISGPVAFGSAVELRRSSVGMLSAGGSPRNYHGHLVVRRSASGLLVMDALLLEHYLRAVVSLEVPGDWTAAALQAQAVAARSYALMVRRNARAAGQRYDICDSTSCQVFGSIATESSNEVAAVKATAGEYLQSGGEPAFTQFSSANGGYSVAGSRPYLVAKPDPYDGVVTGAANWGHSWERNLTAGAIESTWSTLGTLKRLVVLGRDGNGSWGGRVQSVALVGSRTTVTLSGDAFRSAMGLKSTWWTVTNAGPVKPERPAPREVTGISRDRALTVTWQRPQTKRAVFGYRVSVTPDGGMTELAKSRRKIRVRGLVNGVQYQAKVRAVYATGPGRRAATGPVVPTSETSYFRSVAPARLWSHEDVDRIAAGGAATIRAAGLAGVPRAGTRAVLLRVSAGGPRRGNAVVWRAGRPAQRLTAVTFGRREVATGLVSVPVSRTGRITVGTTVPASLLAVDVVGYYTESGLATWSFRGASATAVADTRRGVGVDRGRIRSGLTSWLKVSGAGGVPTHGATAVMVNVVLVNPSQDAALSLSSPRRPRASGTVVRSVAGARRAATAVVRLDSRGRIPLRLSAGRAHVVVDVLGWFAEQDGTAAGRFRTGSGAVVGGGTRSMAAGSTLTVPVAGTGEVPSAASAVVLLVRVAESDADGWASLRPAGGKAPRRPLVPFDGSGPVRNLLTVPVGADGAVEVTVQRQDADVTLRVVGWYS